MKLLLTWLLVCFSPALFSQLPDTALGWYESLDTSDSLFIYRDRVGGRLFIRVDADPSQAYIPYNEMDIVASPHENGFSSVQSCTCDSVYFLISEHDFLVELPCDEMPFLGVVSFKLNPGEDLWMMLLWEIAFSEGGSWIQIPRE